MHSNKCSVYRQTLLTAVLTTRKIPGKTESTNRQVTRAAENYMEYSEKAAKVNMNIYRYKIHNRNQGLWASSLQFTSPLEFNAIFRDGFTLRHELTAGSEIRDPVPAKFKHVTKIVTCTCTMLWLRHIRAGTEISKKLTSNPRLSAKNTPLFLFPQMGHSLQIFA